MRTPALRVASIRAFSIRALLGLLSCVGLASCAAATTTGGQGGGSARASSLVDDRPLVVAGPRCSGSGCRCREVDARGYSIGEASSEAPIAEGMKRFELRTERGADDVRITVQGRGTLHKGSEVIESTCGYVDLPPGEHRVRMRVTAGPGEGGTSPRLLIYERSEKMNSWYATFGLACNDAGPCTRADMQDRVAEMAKAHGLFDHCGSVKVTGIKWDAEKAPDERVTSLDLELTLKVYKFSPRFPRGGVCKGLSGE